MFDLLPPSAGMGQGFFYPWLFERRGIVYDALHLFVHPHDGYRLSDRIWRADAKTRNMIDQLLAHEIRQGNSAVNIAKKLEQFLKQERKGVRTKKPYGRWGSYDARRLARTEITAAFGRSTLASSMANPFVDLMGWFLSPSRVEDWDCNCKENSERDAGHGPGIYSLDNVPDYPDHPHCMCTLRPQVTKKPSEVVEDIRTWLDGGASEVDYGSLFDLSGLIWSILQSWGMKVVS